MTSVVGDTPTPSRKVPEGLNLYLFDITNRETGEKERHQSLCDSCFEEVDQVLRWQPQWTSHRCVKCRESHDKVLSFTVGICSQCSTDIAEFIGIGWNQKQAKDNDSSSSEYDDDLPF